MHGCLRHLSVRRDLLTIYAADVAVRRLPGLPRRTAALTGGGGTNMAAAKARRRVPAWAHVVEVRP